VRVNMGGKGEWAGSLRVCSEPVEEEDALE